MCINSIVIIIISSSSSISLYIYIYIYMYIKQTHTHGDGVQAYLPPITSPMHVPPLHSEGMKGTSGKGPIAPGRA